jgi:hypothetical protein
LDNDVSQVIDRTALIENMLNQVILNYAAPRKDAFELYWDVLLDSSIMPLGSKLRVAMAISQRLNIKIDQDSLHKVVTYRNAFAHHPLDSHPTLVVGKTPDEDEQILMLHIVRQSGKTDRKSRDQALNEFNSSYELAKTSLSELLNAIKRDA